MNKNSIFLICNGILVFLAKTSNFVRPSDPDVVDMLQRQKRVDDGLQLQVEQEEEVPDKHIIVLEESVLSTDNNGDEVEEEIETIALVEEMKVGQEFEHDGVSTYYAENELQSCCLFDNNVDYDRDKKEELCRGEVDEELEKLSNEELNKKFEDFIRKMKEEFKINEDQQQQLVVVK